MCFPYSETRQWKAVIEVFCRVERLGFCVNGRRKKMSDTTKELDGLAENNEKIKEFCDKAIENDVTIKDLLYSIMLLAVKR